MNIINYDGLVSGVKYRGEVLIVDFGLGEYGIKEDCWYVILNDGEIVEVKE